jgi:lipoate-protein ligase A
MTHTTTLRQKLRVIHDPPGSGTWNMGVDEAMFTHVAQTGEAILRFYTWSEPTLSLGYFQNYSEREQHASSLACAVVRRSSGGGAILHDQEWTYSIALPITQRWSHLVTEVYDWFHVSLCRAFQSFQISPQLCSNSLHNLAPEPFLCFQRRAQGDVLLQSHKIAGSAQRRKQHALLQHGSVLMCRSTAAPELLGWQDLVPDVSATILRAEWETQLNQCLSERFEIQPSHWSEEELENASKCERSQFASPIWTRRR